MLQTTPPLPRLQVLGRDKDNVKALFRRGRARVALGQTESAIADFERVAAL